MFDRVRQRADQVVQERLREAAEQGVAEENTEPDPSARPETLTCHWCGNEFDVKRRGRLPRWCSDECRHRAWEQERAAASGRSAVRFVERTVTVEHEVVREVRVVTPPRNEEWAVAIRELARDVDTGRFYYRDLAELMEAHFDLGDALNRRLHPAARR